jgi:hypothetical protein
MGSPGHEGERNVVALTPLARAERFEVLLNGGDPISSFLDGLGYFKDPLLSVCVVDYNCRPRTRGGVIAAIHRGRGHGPTEPHVVNKGSPVDLRLFDLKLECARFHANILTGRCPAAIENSSSQRRSKSPSRLSAKCMVAPLVGVMRQLGAGRTHGAILLSLKDVASACPAPLPVEVAMPSCGPAKT